MTTGQTLLTIVALLLLSILILRVNSAQLLTSEAQNNSKFTIVALSIANSLMEEAKQRAFDAATDTQSVKGQLNQLSAPNMLGKAPGEQYPNFNDFDDYAWFTYPNNPLIDTTSLVDPFSGKPTRFDVFVDVGYVNEGNLNTVVNQRTWFKKMTVTVYSDAMQEPVQISTVYSYWFYLQ